MSKKQISIMGWVKETVAVLNDRPFDLFIMGFLTAVYYALLQNLPEVLHSQLISFTLSLLAILLSPYLLALQMATARHVVDERLPANILDTAATLWKIPNVKRNFGILAALLAITLAVTAVLCFAVATTALKQGNTMISTVAIVFFFLVVRSFWAAPFLVVDAYVPPYYALKKSFALYFKNFFKIVITDFFIVFFWGLVSLAIEFVLLYVFDSHRHIFFSIAPILEFFFTTVSLMTLQIVSYLYYRDLCENTHHFPVVREQ